MFINNINDSEGKFQRTHIICWKRRDDRVD
jgi:hypothetical protein